MRIATELKPKRNKKEHRAALKEIDALWNADDGSPQADRLEVLAVLVERFEQEHHSIPAPTRSTSCAM